MQLAAKKNKVKAEKERAGHEEVAATVGAELNLFMRAQLDKTRFYSDSGQLQGAKLF